MKQVILLFLTLPLLSLAQNEKALEHYGNAVQLFYQEDFASSIEYFDLAIEADANFQFAYFNRGLALEEIKKYEEAIEDFSVVITKDSQYVDAYVHRSDCLLKLGRYEEAIQDLYRLISFNPNVTEPYKKLGLCYYYVRKYALANEAYTVYLSGFPDDEGAWFQKGMSNYYHADYEQAIKDFSEVYALNENYVTALEWRGRCFQKANYIRKACLDWGLAIEKGLESAKAYKKKYCVE